MQIYYLILLLLYCCYGQETPAPLTTTTTSPITTTILSTNTITSTTSSNEICTTTMPTSLTNINATITTSSNTTSGTQTTYYSPSPTSFVYTHFPVFPIHTGSSSSIMSSARPSQSAPFPDDTIGKYGRLHISKASSRLSLPHILLGCIILLSCYLLS